MKWLTRQECDFGVLDSNYDHLAARVCVYCFALIHLRHISMAIPIKVPMKSHVKIKIKIDKMEKKKEEREREPYRIVGFGLIWFEIHKIANSLNLLQQCKYDKANLIRVI